MFFKISHCCSFIAFLLFISLSSTKAATNKSAYEIWAEILEGKATFVAHQISVKNAEATASQHLISYGAEKEGSSSKITRIMTPTSDILYSAVTKLPDNVQIEFLKKFLRKFLSRTNSISLTQVYNLEGQLVEVNFDELKQMYSSLDKNSHNDLLKMFQKFLESTHGKPFSFINETARKEIFKGEFLGVSRSHEFRPFNKTLKRFWNWKPLFGESEKYIYAGTNHGGATEEGWEVKFAPQKSYGEFQSMIQWFREIMGSKSGVLFEKPGHNRIVFPMFDTDQLTKLENNLKLAEIFRNFQSYVILKGLGGRTHIEIADYKNVFSDKDLTDFMLSTKTVDDDSGRGVIRIERKPEKYGRKTIAVEFRSGTKSEATQLFMHSTLASRVGSMDFEGIEKITSWKLLDEKFFELLHESSHFNNNLTSNTPKNDKLVKYLAKKFSLDPPLVVKFLTTLLNVQKKIQDEYKITHSHNPKRKIINVPMLAPLWKWNGAPFLSDTKKEIVFELSQEFIRLMANNPEIDSVQFRQELQKWVRSSRLINDIESYLMPKHKGKPKNLDRFLPKVLKSRDINVNSIDLGIEFSARLPIKIQANYTDQDYKFERQWVETFIDLSTQERENVFENFARTLEKKFSARLTSSVKRVRGDNTHGHGIELIYKFKDHKNRTWRIEWDGIGRSYDKQGKVVYGSERSGHIEIVTPKFNPSMNEIQKVYEAMSDVNLIPSKYMGGGHINIDLAPFMKKSTARELARFLTIFHEYRGIISFMFQDIRRIKNAEPVEISKKLERILPTFTGSHDQLKKLLYNERFFNTRLGRKTRYVQSDLSAYFQDIIPSQFLTRDYDIANPEVLWREQFRADPNIRKMEMRMFNAPRTPYESALQIKLIRAILHKALNSKEKLSGKIQRVKHERYAQNPSLAYRDLSTMAKDLGLNANDFKLFVSESIIETGFIIESEEYMSLEKRLRKNPKQKTFKKAVRPRAPNKAINSNDHDWLKGKDPVDPVTGKILEKINKNALRYRDYRRKIIENGQNHRDIKESMPLSTSLRRKCFRLLSNI
jgi:hypothetical protein